MPVLLNVRVAKCPDSSTDDDALVNRKTVTSWRVPSQGQHADTNQLEEEVSGER